MTGATLFSGFGGADLGMTAAGIDVLWGIEIDDDIASVARMNGLNVHTADATMVDPSNYPSVDYLHASPVCKSFSVAKAGREELEIDRNAAEATVRFLEHIRPEMFTLENVWGYRGSESWSIIYKALMRMGYGIGHAKLNSADYGVPQTRERMIVWASRDGRILPAPTPTHAENPPGPGLFGDVRPRWLGWYEAIEDLIPSLPESRLAAWQMKRLPEELRTLLYDGNDYRDNAGQQYRDTDEPSGPIKADQHKVMPRAVLVHPTEMRTMPAREGDEPCFTVVVGSHDTTWPNSWKPRAVLVEQNANDTSGSAIEKDAEKPAGTVRTGTNHVPRAIVGVRVVQMTPRCLARFQSFPDSYKLSEGRSVACTGIGNAVPPLLQQRLWEHLLNTRREKL